MINEDTIKADAVKALRYDAKTRHCGGFDLKHQPSCYGIALKWILGVKKISYNAFARKYNNTTAQNINHLINRADKSRFFEEDIESMCIVLKISTEYFIKLGKAIEKMMDIKSGYTRK